MARRKKSFPVSFSWKFNRKIRKKLLLAGGALLALVLFLFFLSRINFYQGPRRPAPKPKGRSAVSKPRRVPPAQPRSYRLLPPRVLGPGPKLAFVLDDMGNTNRHASLLRALGNNVTYSILPFVKYSGYFDDLSLETGAEVILHLPLESFKGTIPGPGLITTQMKDSDVLEHLGRDLSDVPHAAGANNHMGSKGTSDPRLMQVLLKEFRKRNLFFLDSMTSPKSVAASAAGESGTPFLKRDVFLDNVADREAVRAQIREAAQVARKKGYAVAIGHYKPATLEVLFEEIPRLRQEGFQTVRLRDLLRFRRSS